MRKPNWLRMHVLEGIAVLLLVSSLLLYARTFWQLDSNVLTSAGQAGQSVDPISRAEALGLSGDFLGGVLNPVLSFFSFLAVLFTLRLQRKELNATMEELKRTTLAQEASVQLLSEQIRSQRMDAFENTFFSLLNLHNSTFEKITRQLRLPNGEMGPSILQHYMELARSQPDLPAARAVLMDDHSEIDHYISTLFEMLRFIDQKMPGDSLAEQGFYANILKAIMNQDAFEAVAMYAATPNPASPYHEFKQLIERFKLLEELDLGKSQHVKLRADYMAVFPQLAQSSGVVL